MYEIFPCSKFASEASIDSFVNKEAINGTFLQTRRFLDYHPAGKFDDESFLVCQDDKIIAYFPGARTRAGAFYSHPGSTFGGPVISRRFYTQEKIFDILTCASRYLEKNFSAVKLKPTPSLFAKESIALIEYSLERLGFKRHAELSSFTEISCEKDPVENFSPSRRRNLRKTENLPLSFREIETPSEMEIFYSHLEISKAKFNVKPVHSVSELLDLKSRLPENIRFESLWLSGEYFSGMTVFLFPETKVAHMQYSAPNEKFHALQPSVAICAAAIRRAAQEGYQKFSWGISTEEDGKILNESLYKFKEKFNAKASLNLIFTKSF